MIVPTSAKVGYCRNPSKDLRFVALARDGDRRFFAARFWCVWGQVFQPAGPAKSRALARTPCVLLPAPLTCAAQMDRGEKAATDETQTEHG
jgi:hypothetical protein